MRTFDQWRDAARPLLAARVLPAAIEWGDAHALRMAAGAEITAATETDSSGLHAPDIPAPRISASLLQLLEVVSRYRHAGRWELMYRLAWRAVTEGSAFLQDAADADVHNASMMEKAVRRDIHKMHAFVRFREVVDEHGNSSYFSWFEPEHEILRSGARFFVERFPNMQWTLATPDGAVVWKDGQMVFIDGPDIADRPAHDDCEDLWRTYYRSICNVARVNPSAMQREMPQRYWKHLPEAAEMALLIRDGWANFAAREKESEGGIAMAKAVQRALSVPVSRGETPQNCRRCDLWQNATQAVEGVGAPQADIMLVGEQPGDEEDLRGQPFIGPAGKVLDQSLMAAGLERGRLFITNAVKHFKWEPRGKRRLHKKPDTGEIKACNIWLQHEIEAVKPRVIVALGASALRALTGKTLSIDGARQQELWHPCGARIVATYHPSAILRAEGERSAELRRHLESDLMRVVTMGIGESQA